MDKKVIFNPYDRTVKLQDFTDTENKLREIALSKSKDIETIRTALEIQQKTEKEHYVWKK